jgi:hypothetical protein
MYKPPSFQDVKDCIPRNFANISREFSVIYQAVFSTAVRPA